jgi:hypothetical protein
MTGVDWPSLAIAAFSAAVSVVALITSRRVQRASLKLQLQVAQMAQRIRSVGYLVRDRHRQRGMGFRVLNGPDEITMSRATVNLEYKVHTRSLWQHPERVELNVGDDEFGILGIKGEALPFRFKPNDVAEWRFPFSVTYWFAEDLPGAPIWNQNTPAKETPEIEITFSATASGKTVASDKSDPIKIGISASIEPLRGYAKTTRIVVLEHVILGALAKDVLKNEKIKIDPLIRTEFERLVRRGLDLPELLCGWLLRTWEEEGRFGNEDVETFARSLAAIRHASIETEVPVLLTPPRHYPPGQSSIE